MLPGLVPARRLHRLEAPVSGPGAPAHLEIYSGSEAFLEAIRNAAGSLDLTLSVNQRQKRNPAVYSRT